MVVRGRGGGRWWQSAAPIAAAIEALGVDFGVADLAAWFAGLAAGSHELLAGDLRAPSAVMVSVGPTARVQVSLFGAELEARRAALPGALREVLTSTFDAFVAAGVEVLEVKVSAQVTFA